MDLVFKALADPSRRLLLDTLRRSSGLTLTELSAKLPQMTRFGVSSHLRVLADADLISVVRSGRRKLHYLNPVPLVEVQDRWLTDYTATTSRALLALRHALEEREMTETSFPSDTAPTTVFTIVIRAPRARVWEALTATGTPRGWLYDTVTTTDWRVGSSYAQDAEGFVMIDGEVLVVEECSRLTLGFDCHWDADVDAEPAGILDYVLTDADETGELTKLVVSLSAMGPATAAAAERDTPYIYSSLKSELETGTSL
ncbi:ArsR/SmtB family transcription factor [Mumia flava]|uniref:ArsR/SmtB family transcription factor n=1 Tax=Mumia flava TaxID=1348852 RepID=UPI001476B2D3|nr:SRPBCC domain-containing protein [Mumia flava]